MRDPNRIQDVCMKLAEIWRNNEPDWRLAQMFCNLQSYRGSDMFYVDDDDFLAALEKYLTGG